MTTAVLDDPDTRPPGGNPFRIGYRPVVGVGADGNPTYTEVPLTEEDFLHPQEGDHFMAALDHSTTVQQLVHAIDFAGRGRAVTALFSELRIDWQASDLLPHQPDVIVFDRLPDGLPPNVATLAVVDFDLAPLAVFEVTSSETRHIDLGAKFDEYQRAGVPVFLVIDLAAPNDVPAILGFQLTDGQYREMDEDPTLGYWVPGVDLWFRLQNRRLVVAEHGGGDIPTSAETGAIVEGLSDEVERVRAEAEAEAARAEALQQRLDSVDARADAEKARADAADARADAAQQQIDAITRELAELKARLASQG